MLYKRLKDAATGLLSDAVARTDRHSAWNEVFALVLLFVGTLLFFALISYTPKDVPSWIWFSHISPANRPAQNFIGPVGAIIAGICYQFIGAAAYLLAAILLGFRCRKTVLSRLAVRADGWPGSFCLSYRVPVYCMCSRIICGAGMPPSTSKGRAVGSDTLSPTSTVDYSATLLAPRYASPADRNLCDDTDPGHRTASNSSCSRDGCPYAAYERKAGGVAIAPQAAQIGSEGKTGD